MPYTTKEKYRSDMGKVYIAQWYHFSSFFFQIATIGEKNITVVPLAQLFEQNRICGCIASGSSENSDKRP